MDRSQDQLNVFDRGSCRGGKKGGEDVTQQEKDKAKEHLKRLLNMDLENSGLTVKITYEGSPAGG